MISRRGNVELCWSPIPGSSPADILSVIFSTFEIKPAHRAGPKSDIADFPSLPVPDDGAGSGKNSFLLHLFDQAFRLFTSRSVKKEGLSALPGPSQFLRSFLMVT